MTTITRYHDFSAGHRVVGHEGHCAHLHGHNYRIYFTCAAQQLDAVGRVLDFSEIKNRLCEWLEENWDHRMLIWQTDPWSFGLQKIDPSVVIVPFNPTAENMAGYLVSYIGPTVLAGTGVTLMKCTVEETRKCSATYELPPTRLELRTSK